MPGRRHKERQTLQIYYWFAPAYPLTHDLPTKTYLLHCQHIKISAAFHLLLLFYKYCPHILYCGLPYVTFGPINVCSELDIWNRPCISYGSACRGCHCSTRLEWAISVVEAMAIIGGLVCFGGNGVSSWGIPYLLPLSSKTNYVADDSLCRWQQD